MGKYCVKATLASTLAFADENPENLVGDAIVVRRNLIAQGEKEYGNKNRSLPSVKHALKEVEPVGPRRRLAACCGGTTPVAAVAPTATVTETTTVTEKKDCELPPREAYKHEILLERRNRLQSVKDEFPELKPLWNDACENEKIFYDVMNSNQLTFDGDRVFNGNTTSLEPRDKAYDALMKKRNGIVDQKNQKIDKSNREYLKQLIQQAKEDKQKLSTSDINENNLKQMFKAVEEIDIDHASNLEEAEKTITKFRDHMDKNFTTVGNGEETLKTWIQNRIVYKNAAKGESKKKYDAMVKLVDRKINLILDPNDDCSLKTIVKKNVFDTLNKNLEDMEQANRKTRPTAFAALLRKVESELQNVGLDLYFWRTKKINCAEQLATAAKA